MMQRCQIPSASNYKYYGARGITVCARWRQFEYFHADMGECPAGQTLDRIDNSRGYEPGNCRWATKSDQNRNRPSHRVSMTLHGETRSVSEWAARLGISANTINQRRYLGWSDEDALTTPLRSRNGETK